MDKQPTPTPTPTPGPWSFQHMLTTHPERFIRTEEGEIIAYCDMGLAQAQANAAHIVKCVNAHAELVQALEDIKEALEPPGVINTTWLKEHVSKALATLPQGEGKAHA